MQTLMLQPASAPGRAKTDSASPPPATAQVPAAEGEVAPPPPPGAFSSMAIFLPFILLFGLLFLMNRGEKKKRTELESKLKKGDRVVTRSGIIGKLLEVGDRTVRAEIAPGVNVTMLKVAIEGLDEGDTSQSSKNVNAAALATGGKGSKKKKT